MTRAPSCWFVLICLATSGGFAQNSEETSILPLMPWPSSITVGTSGSVPIDGSFTVSIAGAGVKDERVTQAVNLLFSRIARQTGIPLSPRTVAAGGSATLAIVVERSDHKPPQRLGDDESYSLQVSDNRIRLSADKPLGILRGTNTLLQLVQQNSVTGGKASPGFSVPSVTIRDQPRFAWRGLSLDVARHFMPLDEVERTIDGLAAVKLNVLHLHLSDDEGFRVESKRYPKLQQYGSDGMYYTQAQIRGLITYAHDRGVRIVPEFDMPGHATSWLVGYPHLGSRSGPFEITRNFDTSTDLIDPTHEDTYRFLDGFIGEMSKLFPDEYFHIGGDEVNPKEWNQNSRIQAFMQKHKLADARALHTYFNRRLLKILTKYHKHMEGWDEILQPDLPKSILVQSWRGQPSLWQGARQGFQGILSAGYYLDLMYPSSYHYSIDPMKAPGPALGHGGEPKPEDPKQPKPGTPADLTPEQAKLILGGEAAMWDELATPENLDAKLWPRLAAIAERFWSPESTTDLHSMYRRLEITNHWLEWLGLTQRLNLVLMRQRLAGTAPAQPLHTFASLLEPTKGYSRNAETYTHFVPLNRLEDAIPPESDKAREFREEVERYLAASGDGRDSVSMRAELSDWQNSASHVEQMAGANSLLYPDMAVVHAVTTLCQAALESLDYLDGKKRPSPGWKEQTRSLMAKYTYQRFGDLLVPIAPGVAKLVEAVP